MPLTSWSTCTLTGRYLIYYWLPKSSKDTTDRMDPAGVIYAVKCGSLHWYPSMSRTQDTRSTMTRSRFWTDSLGGSIEVLKSRYISSLTPCPGTEAGMPSQEYITHSTTLKQQIHPTLPLQSEITFTSLTSCVIMSTGWLVKAYTKFIFAVI